LSSELYDATDFEVCDTGASYFKKHPVSRYHVSAVPTRLVDQVQLSAVLRSFYGYGRLKTKTDFIDATAWMRIHWNNRATQLAEADWRPMAGIGTKARLRNAMACPVAFVMTYDGKKGRRPCGFPTLCPFCWAREVRQYWLKLEAVFFPRSGDKGKKPKRTRVVDTGSTAKSIASTRSVEAIEKGVKSPYDLVYRRFAFQISASSEADVYSNNIKVNGLSAWLGSRLHGQPYQSLHRAPECRALLRSAGTDGGLLESIHVSRVVGQGADLYPWEATVHQLILAVDGDKVPKQLHPGATAESKRHIVIHKPSRTALAQRVSETFIYPRFLVDPDIPVDPVVEYLDIRRNQRLVVSYGRFRSRTLK
jgi:hypothetical protein